MKRAMMHLLVRVDSTTSSSTARARARHSQTSMDPWRSPLICSSSPPLGVRLLLWLRAWPGTAWPRSGTSVVGRATVPPLLLPRSSPGNPPMLRLPLLLSLLLLDLCLLPLCVCCCCATMLPCLLLCFYSCCAAVLALLAVLYA
jgi:hypothetical protein